jgi:hypothetical protein
MDRPLAMRLSSVGKQSEAGIAVSNPTDRLWPNFAFQLRHSNTA